MNDPGPGTADAKSLARIAELEARVDSLENHLVDVILWSTHEVVDLTAAGFEFWGNDAAIRIKHDRRAREHFTPHEYVPDERSGMTDDVNMYLRAMARQIGEVLIVLVTAFHPRRGLTRLLGDVQVIGRLLKEARIQGHKAETILAAMDSARLTERHPKQ